MTGKVSAVFDVTVVDVENGTAVPGQTVVVVDDRIDKIGAQAELGLQERAQTSMATGST
jgi:hypothetical protein